MGTASKDSRRARSYFNLPAKCSPARIALTITVSEGFTAPLVSGIRRAICIRMPKARLPSGVPRRRRIVRSYSLAGIQTSLFFQAHL